jgi:hypothetical protein
MPHPEAAPGARAVVDDADPSTKVRGRDTRWRARQRSAARWVARWDAALTAYEYDEPFAEREILLALIADEAAPTKKREAAQARLPIADRAVERYEANRRLLATRMWLEEMSIPEDEAYEIACSLSDDRVHYNCGADLDQEKDLVEFVYQTAVDEVHKPTGDRVHVGMSFRPIRRVHCGGRRRPGARRVVRTSSRSSSDSEPGESEPPGYRHADLAPFLLVGSSARLLSDSVARIAGVVA